MSSGINLPSNLTVGSTSIINGTNGTLLRNESGVVNDTDYTVPKTDGTNGQVLMTNGAGAVSFQSISTGITIGTTAITSGTVGRVLFEGTGNVLQEDSALFWDNTNKRLGVGANANNPSSTLFIRNNVAVANDVFILQNGFYGDPIFRIRDNATTSANSNGQFYINGLIYGGNSGVTRRFDLGGFGLGTSFGDFGTNAVWENNQGNIGDGQGTSVIAVSSNLYVNLQTTKKYKFETVTGNFGIGNVGTLGARLDVRAQGALSTDIAFRVRNSADTYNIVDTTGNGITTLTNPDASGVSASSNNLQLRVKDVLGNTASFGVGNGGTWIRPYLNFKVNLSNIDILSLASTSGIISTDDINGSKISYSNSNYRVALSQADITINNNVVGFFSATGLSLGRSSTSSPNGGTNTFEVKNGTSPTTSITDSFLLYSADQTAGNAAPHFRTENGSIIKLYQQSSAGIATVGDLVTVLQNLGLLS